MKTNKLLLFTLILIFFNMLPLNGQNNIDLKQKTNIARKTVNSSKTGNWNDVFTNFMQLAAKNLAGDNKSFEYKTTIFAIKSKADSTLLIDENYVKESFSRNFQINMGLNLDNDYKFKGFSYGFDWALINKRDLSVNTLVNGETAKLYEKYFDMLTKSREKYNEDLRKNKDPDIKKKINQIQDAIGNNADEYIIPIDLFPKDFIKYLPSDYQDTRKYFLEVYEQELDAIKRKPLLKIGFNSNFQKNTKFLDEFDANLVYLQGLKSKKGSKLEIDFRNQFKAKDSITTSVIKRKEFSSQLGLNISIWETNEKSIVELKPNFEYKRIVSGIMEDEKNDQFLANADLRIRILKNLWVPLILKYDIKNNNLFGFLNVSFNFDAMKKE
ncbi:hypothetical protein [Chryseobacterium sediminis]|uniref:hypothetical protein n=1 Tax=Chryseobacterium sediminis TaxID=1679494 RepID=UPI0028579600|nr:hypothetical protein [Chryseobacterium sediminis]MDR6464219.1 hypothetical protein [Chryseobacterium sediminis]